MSNLFPYYQNLFKNNEELLRGLCLALIDKGIITFRDLEKGIIQRKSMQEQFEAEVKSNITYEEYGL